MWYAFRNDHDDTLYGWTQDVAVRDAVIHWLNDRQQHADFGAAAVNAWYWTEVSQDQADEMGLQDYPLVCHDDTRPEDIAPTDE